MSLDMIVLLEKSRIPERRALQGALNDLNIPLILNPTLNLSVDSGFSPCTLKDEPSGFEIGAGPASELFSYYPTLKEIAGDRDWSFNLRWGSDTREGASVSAVCAAFIKSCDAVTYYPADEIVYDLQGNLDELQAALKELRAKDTTKKDFAALLKSLLSDLPGFVIRDRLMFLPPANQILRGLYFDRTSVKTQFRVMAFFLPLCVPTDHLHFSFPKDLRTPEGRQSWTLNDSDLRRDLGAGVKRLAHEFLEPIHSLQDLIRFVESQPHNTPQEIRDIAYCLIRIGEFRKGQLLLRQVLDKYDRKIDWQRAAAEQAESLISTIDSNPSAAQLQLQEWELQTAKNLGLD